MPALLMASQLAEHSARECPAFPQMKKDILFRLMVLSVPPLPLEASQEQSRMVSWELCISVAEFCSQAHEPLSCPKHMYFLNQSSSHANSFQINPMVKCGWIEAVLHGFHCQHSIPTLPPRSLLLLESSRCPVDTAQTQELSRKQVDTNPLYGGQTGGSLRNSPKGSQLQLTSLIIKYMLLGSVS